MHPGASPRTRLLPLSWVVVMRQSGVCRVRRWMSVSEHDAKVVEGRTSRARAPFRMSRICARAHVDERRTLGPGGCSNWWTDGLGGPRWGVPDVQPTRS